MAQARDEAGNIWEIDAQGNPVRLIQAAGQQAPQQSRPTVTPLDLPPPPPPPPPQAPGRTPAGAATEGLRPGFMWVDPNYPNAGQIPIPPRPQPDSSKSTERRAQIKALLANIQELRGLAGKNLAVGSAAEALQGVPLVNQNVRNVQARIEQLQGDITQQIIGQLAEVNQGGVSGLANSPSEAARMAASIAPLSTAQSLDQFLNGLQTAENYYLRQAALTEGRGAVDPKVLVDYLPKERFDEITSSQGEQTALNADSKQVKIPDWYKQSVSRYIAENRDNLDPSQYAAFRVGLDQQAGFNGDTQYYLQDAERLRQGIAQGANITPIQDAQRPTTGLERDITNFAQTPVGAGLTTFGNSFGAGLPALLSGQREAVEAVRQNQPVAGFLGDVGGSIAGTLATGAIGRAAGVTGIAANPMAQNAAFSGLSGATQSEDPLLGAGLGIGASLLGDVAGRALGRALPDVVNPRAMQRLDESVPSIDDLKAQAGREYDAVEQAGVTAGGPDTITLRNSLTGVLQGQSRITPQGRLIDENTPITKAMKLIDDFAGQPMTPGQAGSVRQILSEGRGAGSPNERRIAGLLVDEFDKWADPVLPGIQVPRATAQRYLQGQQIAERVNIGNIRGMRAKGNDVGDSVRTQFGQLDEAIERGDAFFDPATRAAIALAARGDTTTNGLRAAGKYGFGSVLPTTGLAGGAINAVAFGGNPALMAIPMAVGTVGTASRRAAQVRTGRQAQDALNTALGGPQYEALRRQALEEAAIRGGRFGGGIFGSAAIAPTRDY
jgi:hypothetical protein